METILKAKQDGKIRYIGFSAHSEEAAHAAMDRFDFDSILFPVELPDLDQGQVRPVRVQAGEEGGDGHPGPEGDGPPAVAERKEADVEQDLLRAVRRHRHGGPGPAIHPAPACDRHVPARSLGVVQDGAWTWPRLGHWCR